MPIYSKNRTGNMRASMIEADTSYGASDLGRILYESCINDMNLFERIIASDINQINGLREGYLLESDVEKEDKSKIRKIIDWVKDFIGRIIEKISGMFKDIINRVVTYLMKDGSKFIKAFEEVYDKCDPSKRAQIEIKNVSCPHYNTLQFKLNKDSVKFDGIKNYIIAIVDESNWVDKHAIVCKYLEKNLFKPRSVSNAKDYKEGLRDECIDVRDISLTDNRTIGMMKTYLKQPRDVIKALKAAEKEIREELSNTAKKASEELEKSNAAIKATKIAVTAGADIASIVSSSYISVFRECLAISRRNLGTFKSLMNKTLHESAIDDEDPDITAATEIETGLNTLPTDYVEPEVQEVIDSVDDDCENC